MPSLSSSQVATVSLTCARAASIRRGSGGADRVFPRARRVGNQAAAECLDLVPAKAGIICGLRSSPKKSYTMEGSRKVSEGRTLGFVTSFSGVAITFGAITQILG